MPQAVLFCYMCVRARFRNEIRVVYSLPLFTLPGYVFTLLARLSTTEPSSLARSRLLPCRRGRQQYEPPVTVWFWWVGRNKLLQSMMRIQVSQCSHIKLTKKSGAGLYFYIIDFLCRVLNLELLCHNANACLHFHLGSGALATSHCRNSTGVGRRCRGTGRLGQDGQTRGWAHTLDWGRACVWTWMLHGQSSHGLASAE